MKEISRAEFNRNTITSNPLIERLLARRGLNRLVLDKITSPLVGEVCFQCEDVSIRKQGEGLIQWKIKNGKLKEENCHSEDEVRRISISWLAGAKPCDSSLRSERQALCHTALDAVSQELSFSSITFPSSSTEGRRSSLLKSNRVDSQPFRLRMTERTHCHCESRSGVAIQYPKYQDCFVVLRTPRNDGNEPFNHSTLQPFNYCESSPHPSPLPKERENPVTNLTPLSQCKTWRTLPC